ncbi:hypothetical protein I546_4031 [Mycobacterium kansasii 732]|nr:hypothetical protein I546_4031 [Mycobacterium kansasii 732]
MLTILIFIVMSRYTSNSTIAATEAVFTTYPFNYLGRVKIG